jgi:hypothetical protein
MPVLALGLQAVNKKGIVTHNNNPLTNAQVYGGAIVNIERFTLDSIGSDNDIFDDVIPPKRKADSSIQLIHSKV